MQEQLEIEIEDEQQQPLYPSPEKADDEARGDRVAIYVAYLGRFSHFIRTLLTLIELKEKKRGNADKSTKVPS